ncbi:MAG TPA: hypothetical protein VNU25_03395 [Candidatus Paceibacterota bacterium]|nr:hypothetical protein [Candidatus Paceibacterota bacterium]
MAQAPARAGYPPKKLKPPVTAAKRAVIGVLVGRKPGGPPDIALLHRCTIMDRPARS